MRAFKGIYLIFLIINIQIIQVNAQNTISSGNINDTFAFSDNFYRYYNRIDGKYLQQDGIFTISFNSTQLSPVMNFSYSTPNPVISSTGSNTINVYSEKINGTLYPGNELKITQKVIYCVGGPIGTGIEFYFVNPKNGTAVLHISIIILDKGKDKCGSQLEPPFNDPNFLVPILIAVVIFILLIIFSDKSPPKDNSKLKELYFENIKKEK